MGRRSENPILINLDDGDLAGELNRPSVISLESNDDSVNMPVDGAFFAERLVMPIRNPSRAGSKVIVVLFEAYPVPGRIWTNVHNNDMGDWSGWKSLTPTAAQP